MPVGKDFEGLSAAGKQLWEVVVAELHIEELLGWLENILTRGPKT
jgi:hypothetical protein